MYNKASGYQSLPQRDLLTAKPGLFVATESFVQSPFHRHKGHSFDYIPNVRDNDYSDSTQGWLSWICNVIVCFMVYICTFITFPISGWFVLKVVPNYQRIVVFRLGRVRPPKGPGVVLLLPLIDQWQRVDLRTRAFNIPPCQVTTRDGGVVSVGADIQFRIWSPVMSVVSVQDLNASTRLTAHNAMTTSLGRKSVREIQTERIKLGEYLGMDINEMTKPWGLEVDRVELTVGAVLKHPEDHSSGPGSVILPPSIPGLEGLAEPIQQLAMHFLGNMAGNGAPLVRTGSGSAGPGSPPEGQVPDVTLSMTDQDLLAMFEGTLRPFAAYATGRLKVQGDLKTAMKLEEVIKLLRP
ncbi:stomatin-like protein 1 isoform X2 [Oncorhynchus keta]|uniref:stomatin-like protein 1 isoform X2 n=1 Tax=Oncorhynchus keta TaxID=8018 RepID=UPI00227C8738|nr:stomatin-like protein 1 isoform X2 [Oncorhynchus keta]